SSPATLSIKTMAQKAVACKPSPVMNPASPKSGCHISRFREAGLFLGSANGKDFSLSTERMTLES
ncbi:MAG: hypothetical protein PUK02_01890, partial [Parabacteroides sp.]|nr:hypothetical protein [Parabacteroides sp.]